MPDHALSDHPDVQRQLDRLTALSPGADVLGLERISALLARLGNPEARLPPVFHVAGTNGKGSTCAFLRAAVEAEGLSAHVYTSPHLVRFNERIRLAGTLIEDEALAALLAEVLDEATGLDASFFEITTAAAFLAFSRVAADACIVEVGLGGRLDATNILPSPAACGIAQLGIDHQAFLGESLEEIAAEKAGIAKSGVPLVTQAYPAHLVERIAEAATSAGAPWLPRGGVWDAAVAGDKLRYGDVCGEIALPLPRLAGAHQAMNAALAVAMLRHQGVVRIGETALCQAMALAVWPARLEQLGPGPLLDLLPQGAELWLDGGHNPAAAQAVADYFTTKLPERDLHVVLGLLANKDAVGVIAPFTGRAASIFAVPVEGHPCHPPVAIVSAAAGAGLAGTAVADVASALRAIGGRAEPAHPPTVLILGSLYLAGAVLRDNGQPPA